MAQCGIFLYQFFHAQFAPDAEPLKAAQFIELPFKLGLLIQRPENQEIEGGRNNRGERDGVKEFKGQLFQKRILQNGGMDAFDQQHDQKLAPQYDQTHRNHHSRRGIQNCRQLFQKVLHNSGRSATAGSACKNEVRKITVT